MRGERGEHLPQPMDDAKMDSSDVTDAQRRRDDDNDDIYERCCAAVEAQMAAVEAQMAAEAADLAREQAFINRYTKGSPHDYVRSRCGWGADGMSDTARPSLKDEAVLVISDVSTSVTAIETLPESRLI